jgi:Zn-dependent oligopeptidase
LTLQHSINSNQYLQFLANLEQKLHPLGVQEYETLLKLKANELKAKGEPFNGEFYAWDFPYYEGLYLKKSLPLDLSIKEYFPVSEVISATFEIYQTLLGVSFYEVKDSQTWHSDVQLFAVWAKDAKDNLGHNFIGYCYLDLFPRSKLPFMLSYHLSDKPILIIQLASKYSHAAVWSLLPGYQLPNGKRAYPVAAMVANLAKHTLGCPTLMHHRAVVTFFHELGHVFHNLLSYTQFSCYHGTRVANDFVEAPSQLLENWYIS